MSKPMSRFANELPGRSAFAIPARCSGMGLGVPEVDRYAARQRLACAEQMPLMRRLRSPTVSN